MGGPFVFVARVRARLDFTVTFHGHDHDNASSAAFVNCPDNIAPEGGALLQQTTRMSEIQCQAFALTHFVVN
jgi:hypothetical protein